MLSIYTTEDKLVEICMEGGDWYNIIQKLRSVLVCNGSEDEEWDTS